MISAQEANKMADNEIAISVEIMRKTVDEILEKVDTRIHNSIKSHPERKYCTIIKGSENFAKYNSAELHAAGKRLQNDFGYDVRTEESRGNDVLKMTISWANK